MRNGSSGPDSYRLRWLTALPGAAEGLPKPLSTSVQVEDVGCDVADNAIDNLKEAGRGDAQKYVTTVLYPESAMGSWSLGQSHAAGNPRPQHHNN